MSSWPAGHGRRVPSSDVTVVIATRDRRETLLTTLGHLAALTEPPPVIVVDNASGDGTSAAVRRAHPEAQLVALASNRGTGARNIGVEAARTPYAAFCDDDSWWEEGALARAAEHMERCPRLGLLGARILVGPDGRPDPTCAVMARGPRVDAEPGPSILGFVACGAVVRREAFLSVGGFEPRFGIGGEERLLALDLAAAGWSRCYVEDVVARHHPDPGPRPARTRSIVRNDLWTSWLRRPVAQAAQATFAALHPDRVAGLMDAAAGLPWVLRERRPLPAGVERELRRQPSS
jgi:GT2 family glycosyltransferase